MGRPLVVALDAASLRGGGHRSGVGRYVLGLLGGLATLSPDVSVRALVSDDVPLPAGIERRRIVRRAPGGRPRMIEDAARGPLEAWRVGADVFHQPSPDPAPRRPRPYVQTLHDLVPLTDPDPGLAAMRRRFARYARRYGGADAVIAVSRHSAQEGIRLWGLDPARVHVIHHGIDPTFRPAPDPVPGPEPPYVVVVSEFSPRKGFGTAFAVIGAVAAAGMPHRLKVAGRVPPWRRPELDALVAAAPRPDRVDLVGFVDDLVGLYQGATACLVTSRAEGFGFSAAEAMACGTPVVAFDTSAVPEVVGGAGVLVPPGDVDAMADAVCALTEPARAAELRARSLRRAAELTWARSASAHLDVYRSVVEP